MAVIVGTNSFITLAFADAYHEERNTVEWFDFSQAQREAGVIRGTEYIGTTYWWNGWVEDDAQILEHPRAGLYDRNGRLIPSDEIALQVQQATAHVAPVFAEGGAIATVSAGNIKRKKVASLEIEYFDTGAAAAPTTTLPEELTFAAKILRGLYTGGAPGSISGSVVRVL